MRRRVLGALFSSVVLNGCTSSSGTSQNAIPPVLVRTAESRQDVAAFLTATMVAEVCDQVRGRFLPIAHTRAGTPARGDEPVGGRWWVRDCRARIHEGEMALYMEGVGWAWAEGEKDLVVASWGTANYVFFAGAGTVLGPVDLAFDASRSFAWVQFRPRLLPYLSTELNTRLEANGSLGGKVVSVFTLGLFNDTIDDKATDTARRAIGEAFARQLGAGFALTIDVPRKQRDTTSLNAGGMPLRPFNDGLRWLVNERQRLHARPGGLHIVGPFGPTPAANVDFNVIAGKVKYRAECENLVTAWLEPIVRGTPPRLPPVAHGQAGELGTGTTTRTLAAMCPWYLITEPADDDVTLDVRVRADRSGYPQPGL